MLELRLLAQELRLQDLPEDLQKQAKTFVRKRAEYEKAKSELNRQLKELERQWERSKYAKIEAEIIDQMSQADATTLRVGRSTIKLTRRPYPQILEFKRKLVAYFSEVNEEFTTVIERFYEETMTMREYIRISKEKKSGLLGDLFSWLKGIFTKVWRAITGYENAVDNLEDLIDRIPKTSSKISRWTEEEIIKAIQTLHELKTPDREIRRMIIRQYGDDPRILRIMDKYLK